MADETVSDDFAKGALEALKKELPQELKVEAGGAPAAAGNEPAGEDAVMKLAAELRKLDVTPETARQVFQDLASLQTPEGQAEYYRRFMSSDAGKKFHEYYGKEYVASLMSIPGGTEKLLAIATELGYKPQVQEQEADLSPEQRELRDIKALLQKNEARMAQLEGRTQATVQAIQNNQADQQRQVAYSEFAKGKPDMPHSAHLSIAKRAHQMARYEPEKYGSQSGFRRACEEIYADYVQVAPSVASPRRPTSIPSFGGGATNGTTDTAFNPAKHSLKDLDKFISAAAGDYQQALTEE